MPNKTPRTPNRSEFSEHIFPSFSPNLARLLAQAAQAHIPGSTLLHVTFSGSEVNDLLRACRTRHDKNRAVQLRLEIAGPTVLVRPNRPHVESPGAFVTLNLNGAFRIVVEGQPRLYSDFLVWEIFEQRIARNLGTEHEGCDSFAVFEQTDSDRLP